MAIRLYGTRQCPQLTQTTAGEPASHGRHTTRASPISSLPNPLARCDTSPEAERRRQVHFTLAKHTDTRRQSIVLACPPRRSPAVQERRRASGDGSEGGTLKRTIDDRVAWLGRNSCPCRSQPLSYVIPGMLLLYPVCCKCNLQACPALPFPGTRQCPPPCRWQRSIGAGSLFASSMATSLGSHGEEWPSVLGPHRQYIGRRLASSF